MKFLLTIATLFFAYNLVDLVILNDILPSYNDCLNINSSYCSQSMKTIANNKTNNNLDIAFYSLGLLALSFTLYYFKNIKYILKEIRSV